MNIYQIFLTFIIYSMIGWTVEVITSLVVRKKFINRGFLIGPYCPIYGVGGILITIFLTKYSNSIITLFVMSVFFCTILEYITSYLMEKLFKARWWDYSNKKFNINGRICLETMIPFGLMGCLAVKIINPLIKFLFSLVDAQCLNIISGIIFLIFILDLFISLEIISNFKKTAISFLNKDNTEEITKKVREVLFTKSVFTRRLVNAFPKFKSMVINIKDELIKTKDELKELKLQIKKTKKEANEELKLLDKIRKEVKKQLKKTK